MNLLLALAFFQPEPPPIPVPLPTPVESAPKVWMGIRMDTTEPDKPVKIVSLIDGAPASISGIKEGDVILKVDGAATPKNEDVINAVKVKQPGDAIAVEIERGGRRHVFRVVLASRPANPDADPPIPAPGPKVDYKTSAAEKSAHERMVKGLIAKLGADDYEVREAATESLVKMGPGVVEFLAEALKAEDMEVRARAETVSQRAPRQPRPGAAGGVVAWRGDLEAALAEAKKASRGVLVYFNDPG